MRIVITNHNDYRRAEAEFCRLWDKKHTGGGLDPDESGRFAALWEAVNNYAQMQDFYASIAAGDYRL